MKAAQAAGGEAEQELLNKFFPECLGSSNSEQQREEKMDEEKKVTEGEEEGGEGGEGAMEEEDPFLPSERPIQNNRKRCWVCRTKLELAQRELGSCKCGKLSD